MPTTETDPTTTHPHGTRHRFRARHRSAWRQQEDAETRRVQAELDWVTALQNRRLADAKGSGSSSSEGAPDQATSVPPPSPKVRKPRYSVAEITAMVRTAMRRNVDPETILRCVSAWNRTRARPSSQETLRTFLGKLDDEVYADDNPAIIRSIEHSSTPRTKPTGEETRHYYKTHNAFYDAELPLRSHTHNLLGCLHRHANGRTGRIVRNISHDLMARQCNVSRNTVWRDLNFLDEVTLINIRRRGGAWRGGRRLCGVYHVPPLSELDLGKIRRTLVKRNAKAPSQP